MFTDKFKFNYLVIKYSNKRTKIDLEIITTIDLFLVLIDQILMIDQYAMYWFSLIGSQMSNKEYSNCRCNLESVFQKYSHFVLTFQCCYKTLIYLIVRKCRGKKKVVNFRQINTLMSRNLFVESSNSLW